MKLATQLLQESATTTSAWGFHPTNTTPTSVSGFCFAHMTFNIVEDAPSESNHPSSIRNLISERESDPRKAAALARAREKLGLHLSREASEHSLAGLRLSQGFSQTQLAAKMGVQQPYIARIERGDDDLKTSTIENLAAALGVGADRVFSALAAARTSRKGDQQ